MTHPNRSKIRHSNAMIAIAIILVLWLSWAYIAHQYEFDVSKHHQHHCQLFTSLQHAVSHTPIILISEPQSDIFSVSPIYHLFQQVVFSYLARSPPVDLIK